jgi:hypothetical protein
MKASLMFIMALASRILTGNSELQNTQNTEAYLAHTLIYPHQAMHAAPVFSYLVGGLKILTQKTPKRLSKLKTR